MKMTSIKILVKTYKTIAGYNTRVNSIYIYDLQNDKLKHIKDYLTSGNAERFNDDINLTMDYTNKKHINLNYEPHFQEFKQHIKNIFI